MNRIGRSELNYGEHRSIEHTLGKIEDVTLDEVNAIAHQLLTRPCGAAVLGPQRSKQSPHSRSGASGLIGTLEPMTRLSRRQALLAG